MGDVHTYKNLCPRSCSKRMVGRRDNVQLQANFATFASNSDLSLEITQPRMAQLT